MLHPHNAKQATLAAKQTVARAQRTYLAIWGSVAKAQ
ncbi:hypothetical protein I41_08730 [Lacipirellula limnantheis]|uniref:Uncharacterized protein n=1 Tax=Lacipirellula limnantheis TaxID=2528024 RepID=A0A517TTM7_9BACT|nr:hypothetical protein I41_08730 [Lacipirellula limnantheis]